MNFFDLPREIRDQIYSELLTDPEIINFSADQSSQSTLFRSKRNDLCPAVLRLNKQTHSETSPVLYSKNRFHFNDTYTPFSSRTDRAPLSLFLSQIGTSQAHLIRHIHITFPTSICHLADKVNFYQAHIANLELIRNTCQSISTLTFSVPPNYRVGWDDSGVSIADEMLNLVPPYLEPIRSLKDIIVDFQRYSWGEITSDEVKEICERGWKVESTLVPRKNWIGDLDQY
jgi:hypothetical protein